MVRVLNSHPQVQKKKQKREPYNECSIWGNGLNKNSPPMWKTPWPPWGFRGLTATSGLKGPMALLISLILSSGPDPASSCLHIQAIMLEYFVAAFYDRHHLSPDVLIGNVKYHKVYTTVTLSDPYLLLFLTWAAPPISDRQKKPWGICVRLRILCLLLNAQSFDI